MNDKEYDAMDGIRRSDLWWMSKTPAHFIWHLNNKEQSSALLFGSAAHKYVLEHDDFFDEYAVIPEVDRRTKIGKETIEVFKREHQKQEWINNDDFEMIQHMHDALYANTEIAQILNAEHRTEVPFIWKDEETGEVCKCKADIITELDGVPYVIDYKTTTSCEDGAFERSCRKFGYKFQAGFYTDGIDLCTMEEHRFAFIAQEKTAPYFARLFICDEGFVNAGKREYHKLLKKYHECKESNEWKGYDTEYLYAEEYE